MRMVGELTHQQYIILYSVSKEKVYETGNDTNMETCWELVEEGYLQKYVTLVKLFRIRFHLTKQGLAFLKKYKN